MNFQLKQAAAEKEEEVKYPLQNEVWKKAYLYMTTMDLVWCFYVRLTRRQVNSWEVSLEVTRIVYKMKGNQFPGLGKIGLAIQIYLQALYFYCKK